MTDKRITYSIDEVSEMTGLCRRTIYAEIERSQLQTCKVGRRRLVTRRALDKWIAEREQEGTTV